MTKQYLKFEELSEVEKDCYLSESWCFKCNKPDLGIKEPLLYIEEGKTFIEGKCVVCGEVQRSQIITKEVDI